MSYNGVVGANCINRMMLKALLDGLPEGYNDLQGNVLADTLERLPDCGKLIEDGNKPLEPNKTINEEGNLVEIPKKQKKLSQYNIFVKQCMSDKKHDFSSCASLWKEEKVKLKPIS